MIRPITNKGSQCFLELSVTVRGLWGLDFTTEHAASTTGLYEIPGNIEFRTRGKMGEDDCPVNQSWLSEGRQGLDQRVGEGVYPVLSPLQTTTCVSSLVFREKLRHFP